MSPDPPPVVCTAPRVSDVRSTKPRRPGPSVRTRVAELRDGSAAGPRGPGRDRGAAGDPGAPLPALPAQRVAVTMRTPGHDFELAAGWLVHEGVTTPDGRARRAVLHRHDAHRARGVQRRHGRPRHSPALAAHGTAGQLGLRGVRDRLRPGRPRCCRASPPRSPSTCRPCSPSPTGCASTSPVSAGRAACTPPGSSRSTAPRSSYARTSGGTTPSTRSSASRILAGEPVPPVLVLSGRIGFELVQKAVVSGVSAIVAVGAPTSLALSLAEDSGMVLVGFTRSQRCVVYAGADRVLTACDARFCRRPLLAWPHAHPAHLRLAPRPVVPRRGPPRRAGVRTSTT